MAGPTFYGATGNKFITGGPSANASACFLSPWNIMFNYGLANGYTALNGGTFIAWATIDALVTLRSNGNLIGTHQDGTNTYAAAWIPVNGGQASDGNGSSFLGFQWENTTNHDYFIGGSICSYDGNWKQNGAQKRCNRNAVGASATAHGTTSPLTASALATTKPNSLIAGLFQTTQSQQTIGNPSGWTSWELGNAASPPFGLGYQVSYDGPFPTIGQQSDAVSQIITNANWQSFLAELLDNNVNADTWLGPYFHDAAYPGVSGPNTPPATLINPGNIAVGDLLIAVMTVETSVTVTLDPSSTGWTLLDTRGTANITIAVAYCQATSSNPAQCVFNWTGNHPFKFRVLLFKNVHPTNPLITSSMQVASGTNATIAVPGLTTGFPCSLVVMIHCQASSSSGTVPIPSDPNYVVDVSHIITGGHMFSVSERRVDLAGDTTPAVSVAVNTSGFWAPGWVGYLIELRSPLPVTINQAVSQLQPISLTQ